MPYVKSLDRDKLMMTTFVLSVAKWIDKTNVIGLYVKRGKYGGTYAHKDIAFEFTSAIL